MNLNRSSQINNFNQIHQQRHITSINNTQPHHPHIQQQQQHPSNRSTSGQNQNPTNQNQHRHRPHPQTNSNNHSQHHNQHQTSSTNNTNSQHHSSSTSSNHHQQRLVNARQHPTNVVKPVNQPGTTTTQQLQPQQASQPNAAPLPAVLPKGWKKEEIVRTTGITSGLVDVVYAPGQNSELTTADMIGKKFKTKLELQRIFGEKYDTSLLDFKRGKISQLAYRKHKRNKNLAANPTNYLSASKYDNYLNLPSRQTASIFKQSVFYVTNNHKNEPTPTVVSNFQAASTVPNQTLTPNQLAFLSKNLEKPKPNQLFWELRFNNLRAIDSKLVDLEKNIKQEFDLEYFSEFKNFSISNENVLRSVAVSWYLNQNKFLIGQDNKEFVKNPRIFIDREQPLIPAIKIKDEDIKSQEDKIKELRKNIQLALEEYESSNLNMNDDVEELEIVIEDKSDVKKLLVPVEADMDVEVLEIIEQDESKSVELKQELNTELKEEEEEMKEILKENENSAPEQEN